MRTKGGYTPVTGPVTIRGTDWRSVRWKGQWRDVGEHRHHDLYQLLAYCSALDTSQGMLIYPRHLAAVVSKNAVRNSDVSITEISIELGGDLDVLRAACGGLADVVLSLAAG